MGITTVNHFDPKPHVLLPPICQFNNHLPDDISSPYVEVHDHLVDQ